MRPTAVIDYDGEIAKLKNQLKRAKKAYIEEIDTLEEYRENKTRLTDQLRELTDRREEAVYDIDPDDLKDRCRHALDILKSDASIEEKSSISHDLIDRIEVDTKNREITIKFYG